MSNYTLINTNQEVATFYFKAKTNLICPGFELENYEVEKDILILSFSFSMGLIGIEGTIAVGIPPTNEDIDAWDLSRKAGEWDWYSIFGFNIRPNINSNGTLNLHFFNQFNTFFEIIPLLTVHELHLNNYKNLNINFLLSNYMDWDNIDEENIYKYAIDEIIKILKIEFEGELIDKPIDVI